MPKRTAGQNDLPLRIKDIPSHVTPSIGGDKTALSSSAGPTPKQNKSSLPQIDRGSLYCTVRDHHPSRLGINASYHEVMKSRPRKGVDWQKSSPNPPKIKKSGLPFRGIRPLRSSQSNRGHVPPDSWGHVPISREIDYMSPNRGISPEQSGLAAAAGDRLAFYPGRC
jgi:hypothetical protein